MAQTEATQVLGVSVMMVKRRLNRGLQSLAAALGDLRPGEGFLSLGRYLFLCTSALSILGDEHHSRTSRPVVE